MKLQTLLTSVSKFFGIVSRTPGDKLESWCTGLRGGRFSGSVHMFQRVLQGTIWNIQTNPGLREMFQKVSNLVKENGHHKTAAK